MPRGPRPPLRTRFGRHREAEGLRCLLRHRQLRRDGKPLRHERRPSTSALTRSSRRTPVSSCYFICGKATSRQRD
eukprot:scaffold51684_cov72-Phaeocystis_antarctica.AAC.12